MNNSNDIVNTAIIDGEPRIALLGRHINDMLKRIVDTDCNDFRSVRHDIHRRFIAELKDVINHFAFVVADYAFFLSLIHHEKDLLLSNVFSVIIRINSDHAKHAVYRPGDKLYERGKDKARAAQRADGESCNSFTVFHCISFRNQFAENQCQEGKKNRNDYDTDRTDQASVLRGKLPRRGQGICNYVRKGAGRNRTVQKAGKSNANLNSR